MIAGGALLAEMVRQATSARQDQSGRRKAEGEATVDAALREERRLLGGWSRNSADVVRARSVSGGQGS